MVPSREKVEPGTRSPAYPTLSEVAQQRRAFLKQLGRGAVLASAALAGASCDGDGGGRDVPESGQGPDAWTTGGVDTWTPNIPDTRDAADAGPEIPRPEDFFTVDGVPQAWDIQEPDRSPTPSDTQDEPDFGAILDGIVIDVQEPRVSSRDGGYRVTRDDRPPLFFGD